MLSTWVDIASVGSGITAAVALFITVWTLARQRFLQDSAAAEQFTAWAAYQWDAENGESDSYGVVIVNNSGAVASEVDVLTGRGKSDGERSSGWETDGTVGQRFALVPPGTYFIPQRGQRTWGAPMLVDTSGGKLVTTFPGNERTSLPVTLVPITRRPEPKRVVYLAFNLLGREWHRGADNKLERGKGTPLWEGNFRESQARELAIVPAYQPNPSVQSLIERLFVHFTVPGSPASPKSTAPASNDLRRLGIAHVYRTQGKGQGLRFYAGSVPDSPFFYVSGGAAGTLPNDGWQFHPGGEQRVERSRPFGEEPIQHWEKNFDALTAAIMAAIEAKNLPPIPLD